MKDIQSEKDIRGIAIDEVGVCDMVLPIRLHAPDGELVTVAASISFSVHLHESQKGTHMSRLVRLAHEFTDTRLFTKKNVQQVLTEIRSSMHSDYATLSAVWTAFRKKITPKSHIESSMDYQCGLISSQTMDKSLDVLVATAPVMSLCPCSLAISKIGAHNQRSHVTITAKAHEGYWHGDLLTIIEKNASTDLYSVLKRVDEKQIVDHAYANPKFAEDIVRDVYIALKKMKTKAFEIDRKNMESIHNHNAFARVSFHKELLTIHP